MNHEGGIGLEDYGGRGLLRKITVSYNTVYNNKAGGILVSSEAGANVEIVGNAISSRTGTPSLPFEREGLTLIGNQQCNGPGECFADAENRDFTPKKGSFLFLGVGSAELAMSPKDDYFGRHRGAVTVAGAVEPPANPVVLGIKKPH